MWGRVLRPVQAERKLGRDFLGNLLLLMPSFARP